jgi:hypothetical protein
LLDAADAHRFLKQTPLTGGSGRPTEPFSWPAKPVSTGIGRAFVYLFANAPPVGRAQRFVDPISV